MTNTEKYDEMRGKFMEGTISPDEWDMFCRDVLEELIEENKDVMIRLKHR